MPTRKSAVPTKKAAATPAKKAVAKKTAPAKDADIRNEDADNKEIKATVDAIIGAIKTGAFDGHLTALDDALTARSNKRRAASASASAKPAEKKVAPAPKRVVQEDEPTATVLVTPVANTTYLVSEKFKPLAGAKVKFIRFRADDDQKVVVEMLTDKPGSPKGKRVMIPTKSLVEVKPAAKKTAAKKTAAKK